MPDIAELAFDWRGAGAAGDSMRERICDDANDYLTRMKGGPPLSDNKPRGDTQRNGTTP